MSLNIAIIGTKGIGKFHAREFKLAGCNIVSILTTSKKTAESSLNLLNKEFNISPRPYWNINEMLKKEKIGAVSICAPQETHKELIKICLKNGLHVLCEKPLISPKRNLFNETKEILSFAQNKNRLLSVNTQMAALIPLPYPDKVTSFSVYTEPGTKGKDMLLDHGPHVNSMLIKLIPQGKASDIKIIKKTQDEIIIQFNYISNTQTCSVKYNFKFKVDRPRDIKFSINNREYSREIGENYSQFIVSDGKKKPIEDPLKTSIQMFVDAILNRSTPLISSQEILENASLQQELIYSLSKY